LEQVTRRHRERVAPLEPDVVILYLGWNDLRRITGADASQLPAADLKSPVERWLAAHSSLVNTGNDVRQQCGLANIKRHGSAFA
jgi:lysophospholipase L1-like esterase